MTNTEHQNHPDIGKRVRWQYCGTEGVGKLLAVDYCRPSHKNHLVQLDGPLLAYSHGYAYGSFESNGTYVEKGTPNCWWVESYEVIGEDACHYEYHSSASTSATYNNSIPNQPKSHMQKLISFIKNLTLSEDEKLLRKHGMKDENGNYTEAYSGISHNLMHKENETKIIELVKQWEAEEKKEEKK